MRTFNLPFLLWSCELNTKYLIWGSVLQGNNENSNGPPLIGGLDCCLSNRKRFGSHFQRSIFCFVMANDGMTSGIHIAAAGYHHSKLKIWFDSPVFSLTSETKRTRVYTNWKINNFYFIKREILCHYESRKYISVCSINNASTVEHKRIVLLPSMFSRNFI